jgi:hypothetical protein
MALEVQRSLEEVYPVARPVDGDDARFTYGLAMDVAAVLAHHGNPPVRTGRDLLRVQRALFELTSPRPSCCGLPTSMTWTRRMGHLVAAASLRVTGDVGMLPPADELTTAALGGPL